MPATFAGMPRSPVRAGAGENWAKTLLGGDHPTVDCAESVGRNAQDKKDCA